MGVVNSAIKKSFVRFRSSSCRKKQLSGLSRAQESGFLQGEKGFCHETIDLRCLIDFLQRAVLIDGVGDLLPGRPHAQGGDSPFSSIVAAVGAEAVLADCWVKAVLRERL